jgi:hypothetical protein
VIAAEQNGYTPRFTCANERRKGVKGKQVGAGLRFLQDGMSDRNDVSSHTKMRCVYGLVSCIHGAKAVSNE